MRHFNVNVRQKLHSLFLIPHSWFLVLVTFVCAQRKEAERMKRESELQHDKNYNRTWVYVGLHVRPAAVAQREKFWRTTGQLNLADNGRLLHWRNGSCVNKKTKLWKILMWPAVRMPTVWLSMFSTKDKQNIKFRYVFSYQKMNLTVWDLFPQV